MSLSFAILASGSSGNCSVLRCDAGVVLVDCGIGPRIAAARMKHLGVRIADVGAICLTHLDRDHFNLFWLQEIRRHGIRVHCHESCVETLLRFVDDPDFAQHVCSFDGQPFEPQPGLTCQTVGVAHDDAGCHAFRFEDGRAGLGYATDLGRVERDLLEMFHNLDILAIESNYDPQMQRQSLRPYFLQQRIMGGRGHLSNEQALSAVRSILNRAAQKLPRYIVLLHRSRQCNCPRLVRDTFSRDPRIGPRLVLAEQHTPTHWLSAADEPAFRGQQLELQWG